eukprot:TRINITY_DN2090_c0_g1_i5.p1 TRINITY_DN2090_c0_g1~~TRINITY_DN2090_c0_g1_i5.p1  ORF type:complete len:250 (+),score=-26.70 TRINITY_DN2090_c0_g1_i5:75-752(+)
MKIKKKPTQADSGNQFPEDKSSTGFTFSLSGLSASPYYYCFRLIYIHHCTHQLCVLDHYLYCCNTCAIQYQIIRNNNLYRSLFPFHRYVFPLSITCLAYGCRVLRWPPSLLQLEIMTSTGQLKSIAKYLSDTLTIDAVTFLVLLQVDILHCQPIVLRWPSSPAEVDSEASAGRWIQGLSRLWLEGKTYLWQGGRHWVRLLLLLLNNYIQQYYMYLIHSLQLLTVL